jgi:translation initiation factor 2 alpha subunit (eIF-2alpha)
MKLTEVLRDTKFDENAIAVGDHTRIVTAENLARVLDEDLVAEINARSYFSESDVFAAEFERRMHAYGAPWNRIKATQIDYITAGETLKQFAERIRDDQEF